jgi:hypothetical protein
MASSTTTSKAKGGSPACRKCGKAGFADANGKLQHERRTDPAVYGGRRNDPAGKSKSGAKSDEEPDREHVLNRRIFGQPKE